MERIPCALYETIDLNKPEDYTALLPRDLSPEFTAAELSAVLKIPRRRATEICNVLYNIGAIIRTGNKGRAFLYKKAEA